MPKGSPAGLQQIQRMQGFEWGDSVNDKHVWLDGDTLYTDAKFSGIANSIATGTSTGVSSILGSATLPANALNVDGKVVRIRAWGQFAANDNLKGLQLLVGGAVVAQVTAATTANNAGSWFIDATVQRTGPSAETVGSLGSYTSGSGSTSGTRTTAGSPAFDTSVAQTISIQCTQQTTNGDVTFLGMIVEVVN